MEHEEQNSQKKDAVVNGEHAWNSDQPPVIFEEGRTQNGSNTGTSVQNGNGGDNYEPPPPLQTANSPNKNSSSNLNTLNNKSQTRTALLEYAKERRQRYLFGTLFLGIGVLLFVVLWLYVVFQVTQGDGRVWSPEVALLLIGAVVVFICGLYMILTFPSSSFSKILGDPAKSQPPNRGTPILTSRSASNPPPRHQ